MAALAALLLTSTGAIAHAGAAIELVARDGDDCVVGEVCLELFSLPPDLEPGHETQLTLRNHPNSTANYSALATTEDQADPDHRATPSQAAIAATGPAKPAARASANLTTPSSGNLYVWLDGAEEQGGWETVPISEANPPDETSSSRPVPGPSPAASLLGLAAAALVALRAGRRVA